MFSQVRIEGNMSVPRNTKIFTFLQLTILKGGCDIENTW